MAEFDKAFVSPDIVRVDDKLYKSVVMAKRFPGNELSIAIYPFGLPSTLGNLMVLINQDDLVEVQKLLGEERSLLVPADDEGVVPDEDVVAAQLAVAIKTLCIIADMEETKQEPAESWRQTLFNTIKLAQWAVETIERMEANDGTPSDS